MNTESYADLQFTLKGLLKLSSGSNPALATLLHDYARYHVVLVVLGSVLVLLLTLLSIFCWVRFRQAQQRPLQVGFEQKVYACFGLMTAGVGLLMVLLVAANASNALNPSPGFSLLVETLHRPKAGTHLAQLHQAFQLWLQSGGTAVPAPIQASIAERLAWQQPKAIGCGILLVGMVALGVRLWSITIQNARQQGPMWTWRNQMLLGSGIATVTLSLLLMVMLVGNTQAVFAPITLTLMFG
jgi:hypothetical protein